MPEPVTCGEAGGPGPENTPPLLSDGCKEASGTVGASVVNGKFVNALVFMNRMSGCIINA